MNVAAQVRQQKEQNPQHFCANAKCLWRVVTVRGEKPCPKHPAPSTKEG